MLKGHWKRKSFSFPCSAVHCHQAPTEHAFFSTNSKCFFLYCLRGFCSFQLSTWTVSQEPQNAWACVSAQVTAPGTLFSASCVYTLEPHKASHLMGQSAKLCSMQCPDSPHPKRYTAVRWVPTECDCPSFWFQQCQQWHLTPFMHPPTP